MKKNVLLVIFATLCMYACHQDAVPVETVVPKEIRDSISIEVLKGFLTEAMGTSEKAVVYNSRDTTFVIEGDILISKTEAEKQYKDNVNLASAHRRRRWLVSDTWVRNIKIYMRPGTPPEWVAVTRTALAQWNLLKGVKVKFSEVSELRWADMEIVARIDATSDKIAVAQFPYLEGKPGSSIIINLKYSYIPTEQKLTTMAHELGHTLGIAHTDLHQDGIIEKPIPGTPNSDLHSVMNSVVSNWTGFTFGDKKAVQAMYPNGEWIQMAGSATDIAVGPLGSVFAIGKDPIGADFGIYQLGSFNQWFKLPGSARKITAGAGDVPWIINSVGGIYRYNYNTRLWDRMPGSAKDIAAAGDGSVYMIGGAAATGGNCIYKWNGSNWTQLPGGAVRIAAGAQGMPWIVDNTGKIFFLGGSGAHWSEVPGLATDIFAGPEGSVYITGRTPVYGGYTLSRWNGVDWSLMPGTAVTLAVNHLGTPWAVNSLGEIWYQNL
ncbi:M57 family metalloprotease [Dyadobacter chenwenxiniae]|uniref:M57 family metalloprotease n=1 Tax=Dyadobacter chenwenxiniae TaxID=2906456 RepID=A0A9X1PI81_9BACT|nr:M57 family metalloprotease [Dyadobacter chenwenxiniae]MCF0061772.1 M57 family metalloprotease [Dyadobacter chenwenxiniae]UON81589.1 M57 family metalloprotease [Dyadobacter chenwenxiniae]